MTKDLRAAQKAGSTAGKTAGAAKNTRKAAQKAGETTKKTTDFIARHWKAILTVGVFLLLIVMIFTGLSSCAAVIQGGVTSIVGTSYTAEDEAIRQVEADYTFIALAAALILTGGFSMTAYAGGGEEYEDDTDYDGYGGDTNGADDTEADEETDYGDDTETGDTGLSDDTEGGV